MCFTAMAAASLGSALIGANSAKKASRAQSDSADKQIALQRENQRATEARFAPYEASGANALSAYDFNLGLGERPEGYAGFQSTPGYQFQLDEGMRALEGSAAAGGNVRSGATMKAAMGFGQGLANQDYGNYMNRLQGQVGMGQASAAQTAAAGANATAGISNALGAQGNAKSAGIIGANNAWQGGINNMLSGYQMSQMQGGGSKSGSGSWF